MYFTFCISHFVCVQFFVYLTCIYFICIPLFVYPTLYVALLVYLTLSHSMCLLLSIYFTSCTLNKLVLFDLRSSRDQEFLTMTISLGSTITVVIYCNNCLLRRLSTIMECNGQVTYCDGYELSSIASRIVKKQLLKHLIYVWNKFIIMKEKLKSCVSGFI